MRARADGILRLPKTTQRELALLVAAKLAALGLLYVLCFTPSHRPPIDAMAHIAGATAQP